MADNGHSKGGMIGHLKGLMNTKSFGAQHGARHKAAQKKALFKKKNPGKSYFPF